MRKSPRTLAVLRCQEENESKVRKTARIRNRYTQVPHLSKDTKWEGNKITINIANKRQEVSPFPSSDHKAAKNRLESIRNTRHRKPTNDPQKKQRLGTVSKNISLAGLNQFRGTNLALNSDQNLRNHEKEPRKH